MTEEPQWIKEIRERLKNATPGPWEVTRDLHEFDVGQVKGGTEFIRCGDANLFENLDNSADENAGDWRNNFTENLKNAEFVASAPTDIAHLLEAIEHFYEFIKALERLEKESRK